MRDRDEAGGCKQVRDLVSELERHVREGKGDEGPQKVLGSTCPILEGSQGNSILVLCYRLTSRRLYLLVW